MNKTLKYERLGIALDDTSVADLDFADDICLLEDNGPDARRLLTKITEKAALIGLQINVSKTVLFTRPIPDVSNRRRGHQISGEPRASGQQNPT